MNMTKLPTVSELAKLLAGLDDSAGNHMIWIDADGEVHATCLPVNGPPPLKFVALTPGLRVRFRTLQQAGGHVGPAASQDRVWVLELFDALTKGWETARRVSGQHLVG